MFHSCVDGGKASKTEPEEGGISMWHYLFGKRNQSPNGKEKPRIPLVKGGVLLHGCEDEEAHRNKVRQVCETVQTLKGKEGLREAGFEYRLLPCDEYFRTKHDHRMSDRGRMSARALSMISDASEACENGDVDDENENENDGGVQSEVQRNYKDERDASIPKTTRLFHIETNTAITLKNRRQFIADGDMYDAISKLCQDVAHDVMIALGNLQWVTIDDTNDNKSDDGAERGDEPKKPIQALVSSELLHDDAAAIDSKPTLLCVTGKGKVRAGIFSRQHLMVSGLECSTAIHLVLEAVERQMNIVMIDPNVHGDRSGMTVFEKSMRFLFRRWEQPSAFSDPSAQISRHLFVLSHSQSGAQFQRYLMDKAESYLPYLRSVVFTDSTHNLQWVKDNQEIRELLESERCVYYKSFEATCYGPRPTTLDILRPMPSVGQPLRTDSFWEHRFGKIDTRCAGTTLHELTNWFARFDIWDHFDSYLSQISTHTQQQQQHENQ